MFFKKFKAGWFKKARAKWYRKNVRSWCAFGGVGLGGKLEYEPGLFSYRSGFGFHGYEDYYNVGPERAFWLARRQAKREGNHFYFKTHKEFKEATSL